MIIRYFYKILMKRLVKMSIKCLHIDHNRRNQGRDIRVLFDTGGAHSLISIDLVSKIKKPKEELIQTLLVSTPLGRLLLANNEIGDYEIKIREVTIENDLLILDLRDFDVILEMDWLSKYHACIDYFIKQSLSKQRQVQNVYSKENGWLSCLVSSGV